VEIFSQEGGMWRSSTSDTGTVSLLCEEMGKSGIIASDEEMGKSGTIASGNVSTPARKFNVPWL
jgi:hypothetical protein